MRNKGIQLPDGCALFDFSTHGDSRGALTEMFREEWQTGIQPVQWNFVRSNANVLRGVHVHVVHSDYLVCTGGTMLLGLVDVRPDSPTHRLSTVVTLSGDAMQAALVPKGVAHGFHFPGPATLCYAVSHYWNTVDEIGCRWDDPDLGLDWDVVDPVLSERDRTAGSAAEMVAHYLAEARRLSAGNG